MVRRLLIPVAALVLAALAAITVLQQMAAIDQSAERRALLARNAELTRAALAPGSALACLDGGAGEKVGDACEAAVFASPQAVAAAVALESERLAVLQAAYNLSKHGDALVMPALAAMRRAAELDRYGIVAHVLSTRDGCTVKDCTALAMFHDTTALKANLKAQAFEAYVARYAPHWSKPAEVKAPPVAEAPQAAPPSAPSAPAAAVAAIEAPRDTKGTARPVDSRWTFPSAASIPPVSIMTPEPKLPKSAELPQPKVDPELAKSLGAVAEPGKKKEEEAPRLPPERPKSEAAPAAAPR
jgi:hypothetical protein